MSYRRQHWIHSLASQVKRESLVDVLAMVRALEREEMEHRARNERFVRVNRMMRGGRENQQS